MSDRAPLNVLALEPYYGGSHRAFLDTWIRHSVHRWTLISMPARHWKWRMRGSAMWFAENPPKAPAGGYDAVFTCDMTAVADLRALLPAGLGRLPVVCYFHENQLTYPLSPSDRVDYQFGFTNMTSALASDAVWFNSQAHRGAFLEAARNLLRRMSDCLPRRAVGVLEGKSAVQYPAIEVPPPETPLAKRPAGTTRILWSHRWEYDKNPESFFRTMLHLHDAGLAFELILVGEQFRTIPEAFKEGFGRLSPHIVHAGFLDSRRAYWEMLAGCHIVISTALQENFGIAMAEAMLAGCYPLLPDRLSYPELLPEATRPEHLYADDPALLGKLRKLLGRTSPITADAGLAKYVRENFAAPGRCRGLDGALQDAIRRSP